MYLAVEFFRLPIPFRVLDSLWILTLPICKSRNGWYSGGVVMTRCYDYGVKALSSMSETYFTDTNVLRTEVDLFRV